MLGQWEAWLDDAEYLDKFEVPRTFPIIPPEEAKLVVHYFSDASSVALGAVAYAVYVFGDEENGFHSLHKPLLLMAKSRLAPSRGVSIAKLELAVCTISVTLNEIITEAFDIEIAYRYYWCDSTIALQYIFNTTRVFKPFVDNRKTIIHNGTEFPCKNKR